LCESWFSKEIGRTFETGILSQYTNYIICCNGNMVQNLISSHTTMQQLIFVLTIEEAFITILLTNYRRNKNIRYGRSLADNHQNDNNFEDPNLYRFFITETVDPIIQLIS
jgi:hypothetical protein